MAVNWRVTLQRAAIVTLAVVTASAVITGCGSDDSGGAASGKTNELVIDSFGGSWGDAQLRGFIEPFESATGIKVTLLPTQDIAKTKAAIQAGDTPPVDISDGDFRAVAGLSASDLLEPIDYTAWDEATLSQVPAKFRQQYAIGWARTAFGICWDSKTFPDDGLQPAGWADFWNTTKFPGKRAMLAWNADPFPEGPLLADGVAPADLYPLDIDKSLAKLRELKADIPTFPESLASLQQLLVDGNVSMIDCFSHRYQGLVQSGLKNLRFSFAQAKELDETYFVWKNAPNKANAMKFLAFVQQAQNQANWAKIAYAGPVNDDALALMPADVAKHLPTHPDNLTKMFPSDDDWYTQQRPDGQTNYDYLVSSAWPKWQGSQ
jgi:putative spermidine/putrescine transport system substrate-binding protein